MKITVKFLLILSTVVSSLSSFAQLTVNGTGMTAGILTNAISGPGVIITNATLNCPGGASGTFSNGNTTNIGLDNGIILTTGQATNAIGPNALGSTGTDNLVNFGDPQLTTIEPLATFDPCILEFDIIPLCDTLRLSYVFGSDEYPEFVNAGVNDAFGFFLSGPNPMGGNYVNQNIAVIPGTATPVTIDNVNSGSNASYYVDNTAGTTIEYDGFTTVLEAWAPVTPCATYHMKLAIADAGDGIYDSGVFLDFEGLQCPNQDVTITGIVTQAVEGCIDAEFIIQRTDSTGTLNVNFITGGTATNGADYTLPGGATFPNGVGTMGFTVPAINDGIAEGTETAQIVVEWVVCGVSVYDTLDITIVDGADISFTQTDENCGACDGTASATVNNATAPITYTWSPAPGGGQGTPNITGLCPGTYVLNIVDVNGCTAVDSVVIGSIGGPTLNITITDETCDGDNDGIINATASGGASPYLYDIGGAQQASGTFNGLAPGNYTVTVIDNNGCISTANIIINPGPICCTLTATDAFTDVSCNGGTDGTITITENGGVPPVQYSNDNGTTFQASNVFNGLAAGTYDIVVEDGDACQVTLQVTISEPPALTIANVPVDPTCNGYTDGSITVTAGGGTPGYQYSNDNGTTFQASNVFNGLAAGTYDIVIEDANGCQITAQVILTDPPAVAFTTTTTDATCGNPDGTITVTVTTGVSPYQYSSDNGATFQASNVLNGLLAGNYDVVVQDANGCTATANVVVNNTAGPTINGTVIVDASCNGGTDGSITVNVSGGVTPYQYSNDNGATFQASNTFNGLAAGTYDIVVEDANGCQDAVQVVVNEPTVVTIATAFTDPLCNGSADGTITLTGSGGTTPYQYSIDNGTTFQASNNFNGLIAGAYDVVVEDANGCQATAQVTLTDPPAVTFTDAVVDATCGNADGSITITASGGDGNYQYSIDGGPLQASNVFNGVAAGAYTIDVFDGNNCSATAIVNVSNIGAPTVNPIVFNDPLCNGSCDGDFTVTVTGGTSPFTYDNGFTNNNTGVFTNLCAGVYIITITDINGCIATSQVTLTDPPAMTYTAALVDLTCFQDGTGSIDITGGGGDGGPYQYSIDNGATFQASNVFNGLAAGTYDIVVQDGNGCTVTGQETLTEPTELTITFSAFDETCAGACDGFAIVIPNGGVTTYSYTWSSSANNSPNENNLCVGTYDLTVTDANGCTVDTLNFPIGGPAPIVINTTTIVDESCNGSCDGSITIDAPLATQFSIDNGTTFQASNTFNGLCAGNYDIVVQDANGCPATTTAIVNSPAPLSATVSNDTTICTGGTATLTAGGLGGTTPYTYLWDDPNASTTATITTTVAGTFNVTVTDDNGCTAQATVTVAIAPPLTVTALTSQSICPGDQVTISAIGGGGDGGPYNYDWTNDDGSGWTASGQFQTVAPTVTTTYTVTVSDNCGSTTTTDQITITVNQEPVVNFSADNLAGCTPVTTTFTNLTDPLMTGTCYWDFGDGNFSTDCNPTHTYTIPGCYDVTLTVYSPDNCVSDTTFTQMICVYAYPQADFLFGPQPTNVLNPTINFANTSTGAISYEWIFDNLGGSNEEHPSFTFPDDGPGGYDVCLVATSANDCVDTICYRVIIDDLFLVYVPNAFTPDGDGDNDYFFPVVSGIEPLSYQFLIYDRWGELIFESRHPELQWGGSVKGNSDAAKQDVYVWKLIVTDAVNGKQHEMIGHVTLLR